MTYKLLLIISVILLILIGFLSMGGDERSDRQSGTSNPIETQATPATTEAVPAQPQSHVTTTVIDPSVSAVASSPLNQPVPAEDLIRNYMTAWSGGDIKELNRLWDLISQCEECLLNIRDLIINQGVPKGMLLELSHRVIQLGDPHLLPVFNELLSPSIDTDVSSIVAYQMVKNGSQQHMQKLLQVLQELESNGYDEFTKRLVWKATKLKNPEGVPPILDSITGRAPVSTDFANQVNTAFRSLVSGMGNNEAMATAIADYYSAANSAEQSSMERIVFSNPIILTELAARANDQGSDADFRKFAQGILNVNSVASVDAIMQLQNRVQYNEGFIIGLIGDHIRQKSSAENLRRLEDYMRNPKYSLNTRIVAAEGLLAVQHISQARYMLEKLVNSSSADDADMVTYVHSRL